MTDQSLKQLCCFVAGAFVGFGIGKIYVEQEERKKQALEPIAIEQDVQSGQTKPSIYNIVAPLRTDIPERRSEIVYDPSEHEHPEEDPPDEDEEDDKGMVSKNKPHIVNNDILEDDYETIPLMYYEEDDRLCDEVGNRVENAKDILGEEFYANLYLGEDTICIKNDRLRTIFEVMVDRQ